MSAPLFIQGNFAFDNSGDNQMSCGLTAVSRGSTIVAHVWRTNDTGTVSVTDTGGGTWTLVPGSELSGDAGESGTYICVNHPGGTITITTETSTNPAFKGMSVHQYTSCVAVAGGAGGGTSTSATAAITTTGPDQVVSAQCQTGTIASAGSGWTLREDDGNGNISEDKVIAAAGPLTVEFGISPSGTWTVTAVALQSPTLMPGRMVVR